MPASAAASAPRGLVAAYGFEEGSGSQVADASGYGNGGTIANATWVDSGAYGRALSFNGSDAVVTVDDSPSLHLKRAMTLEAWVKPSTIGGDWRDVIYKGNDAYYLEASSQADGLPMGGGSFNGAGGEGQVFGDDWLPTGAWSYLAVTYDGSMLRLYVDGKEVASKPQSGMLVASRDPLQIGGDHIFGQYFEGTIDEVRVYDVALAPDAIQKDMVTPVVAGTSGDPEPPSAPGGLAASAVGPGEVDLSWTAASDNVGVTGYDVFRCQGAGCSDFTQLATLGPSTGYEDTSVAPATSYSYRVRALRRRRQPRPLLRSRQRDDRGGARHAAALQACRAARERLGQRHDRPQLGRGHRRPRRDRLPDRALQRRRLQRLHPPGRHDRHQLQRQRPDREHRLHLPGARQRRRRQPRPLLRSRQRDDRGGARHAAALQAGLAARERVGQRHDRPQLGRGHRRPRRDRLPDRALQRAPAAATSPTSPTPPTPATATAA